MATPSRIEGDVHVNGNLTSKTAALPSGTVTNAMVNSSAAIGAEKLQHQYEKLFADPEATTIVDKNIVLHAVYGTTGEVIAFKAGAIVAPVGVAVVDIDLHKNGTTILTTNITLNSSVTAYELASAVIGTTALAVGDVLEAVINETAGAGTAPTGVFVEVILKEDAV